MTPRVPTNPQSHQTALNVKAMADKVAMILNGSASYESLAQVDAILSRMADGVRDLRTDTRILKRRSREAIAADLRERKVLKEQGI